MSLLRSATSYAVFALALAVSGAALAAPAVASAASKSAVSAPASAGEASKSPFIISSSPQNATLLHGVSLEQGAEPTPVLINVGTSKVPVLGYASLRPSGKVTIRLKAWGNVEVDGRVLDAKTHMEGLQLKCVVLGISVERCPASEVIMRKGAQIAVIFYKPHPGFTPQ